MNEEIGLRGGTEFECSNGGVITLIKDGHDVWRFGVENGYATWNDLKVNSYNGMTISLYESSDVTATVTHLTGDSVMNFGITSRVSNGKADFRIEGLKPNSWYRLQFNGVLAETAGGKSHGKTSSNGVIEFIEVEVPDI